jgi:hypothetical protein
MNDEQASKANWDRGVIIFLVSVIIGLMYSILERLDDIIKLLEVRQ